VAGLTKSLACAALACIALALGAGSPGATAAADEPCADATLTPDRDNLERVRTATLCLLNLERARHDLAPLEVNAQLARAAQRYSRRMVRERFFGHVSPGGSTLTKRVRNGTKYINESVRDWSLGENLAWGSRRLSTPRATVRAWMRSSGHRHNILDDRFRDVGIGVAPGAPARVSGPAATYTTEFGYRVTA
jgi:uncharacterized protein YkwD